MKNQLPYCKTSEAVKGYTESSIAKNETNDCVVRAVASAFDVHYDRAHDFVKTTFGRKDRQGTYGFVRGMNKIASDRTRIGRKSCKPMGKLMKNSVGFSTFYSLSYEVKVKGVKTLRQMTVGTFIKKNPKGTFILCVRGHAFSIKDGVVMGNPEDATKTRTIVNASWKVGS
jgi:hypothetical protein